MIVNHDRLSHQNDLQSSKLKTNSVRGKEFRAKRKKYESELTSHVDELRAHVAQLDLTRDLLQGRQLHAVRFSSSGALAKMIHEYFTLFKHGLRDSASQQDAIPGQKRMLMASCNEGQRQELFLRQVMDEDAVVGDYKGPQASIDQWRRYSSSHDDVWALIESVTAGGTHEHPTVELRSKMHARISTNTFRLMFPGALHRRDLQQKFLHRKVVYQCVHHFEFTSDGKIAVETAEFDFIQGLQDAGFSLQDVAELMDASILTPHCLIPDPAQSSSPRNKPPSKLSVQYLLASDEGSSVVRQGTFTE